MSYIKLRKLFRLVLTHDLSYVLIGNKWGVILSEESKAFKSQTFNSNDEY